MALLILSPREAAQPADSGARTSARASGSEPTHLSDKAQIEVMVSALKPTSINAHSEPRNPRFRSPKQKTFEQNLIPGSASVEVAPLSCQGCAPGSIRSSL